MTRRRRELLRLLIDRAVRAQNPDYTRGGRGGKQHKGYRHDVVFTEGSSRAHDATVAYAAVVPTLTPAIGRELAERFAYLVEEESLRPHQFLSYYSREDSPASFSVSYKRREAAFRQSMDRATGGQRDSWRLPAWRSEAARRARWGHSGSLDKGSGES